jgi:glycosyltransferase involved in cell wall biosynthesis
MTVPDCPARDAPVTESVSLFFPVYNDETTVRAITERALSMLEAYGLPFEIIIVNDGSLDGSRDVAEQLASEHPGAVRVVHHEANRGYGAAFRSGVDASRFDWICMVDGDNEYDVHDVLKMLELRNFYRMVIGFRYRKLYSTSRIFVSYVYNRLLRWLFRTPFRDISTGVRIFHRCILDDIALTSDSPFVGAELAIKTMLRGYPVGELGIQTFPRTFGRSTSTSPRNIVRTIADMLRVRRQIFSDDYHLPLDRPRQQPVRRG